MSLKNSMINKLRNEARWVHSGELENFSMECGYKAETGGRVLRKLEEEGLIHKQYDKKGCVWYREGQNLTEKRIWSSALNQIVKTYNPPYLDSKQVYAYISNNIGVWADEAVLIRKKY